MEMRWWLRSCNELPTYPVLGIKPGRYRSDPKVRDYVSTSAGSDFRLERSGLSGIISKTKDKIEEKRMLEYLKTKNSEVDRNLLRVSRPRATTDPAISGSEQSKRDSRLTRSNSACGLDSVELELDFVFTSSSDSKQLDFGQGYLVGSRSFYWA
ncbi:unnamed protein product [Microthlaspi erraticum]|uniref:Uncharacterized protein n=1 Tax=Microthlaspi erraticum TaxID=1685480 RepID=A0A6D2HIH8_9BRAS|nr:unnamed protein product [Microthlaspi erraticum]